MLQVIAFIVTLVLLAWLPRRTKWENCKNLKENSNPICVHSEREGSRGSRRIRTYVIFDDGFRYSSCKAYSSLTTQFVDEEMQKMIVNDAIEKHRILIKKSR